MAKKRFASPFVLFNMEPVDGPVIGNGSAHGNPAGEQDWPMTYGMWLDQCASDYNGDGGIDWQDYSDWYDDHPDFPAGMKDPEP